MFALCSKFILAEAADMKAVRRTALSYQGSTDVEQELKNCCASLLLELY